MTFYHRLFLTAIMAIAAFLLFYNLDNQYLWQDEAETGILARNIFKFGLPKADDGKNMVLLFEIPEFSKNYILGKYWMGQPWLGIYIAHLSFRVFGVSTFAARFPFALIGIPSFILIYLLARRLFRDRVVSDISLVLSVFSVPLILHMRQCRYFSPGIFLTLLCVYLYLLYLEKRKFSSIMLLSSLFLLINTSISYFLAVAVSIVVHMAITEKRDFLSLRNIIFLSALLIFSIPILYIFRLPRRAELNFDWIKHNLRYYIRSINRYIFPWRSIAILYGLYIITRRKIRVAVTEDDGRAIFLVAIFIFTSFTFLLFVNFNSLRYAINIAPLFFMLEAYILARLIKRSKCIVMCVVIPLVIFTNIFSLSFPVKSYFCQYLYEITHDYDGPSEGIVKHLNEFAKPAEIVRVMHRFDNPLIFYTDLKIDNMPPFEKNTFPEWIVTNSKWNEGFWDSDYGRKILERYNEIVLPYPDIPWENRPDDMGFHKFRTDTSAPKVKIYKKRAI